MTALTNEIAKRLGGVPADPDGINAKRSGWAENAIERFEGDTGTDREDSVSDLLGDLMHWCDRNDTDFDNELRRARAHYAAETDEETSGVLGRYAQADEQLSQLLGD